MLAKIKYCVLIISFLIGSTQAQRLLILNEGAYDFRTGQILQPVSVGAYSFETKTYQKILDIPEMKFASDLKIDGNSFWVAADRKIFRFSLADHSLISSLEIEGVRKMAFHENLLLLTRGEYLKNLDSYVQIYDKNSLSLLFEIPSKDFGFTTENIVVHEDRAYIAANNGFDFGKEVGKILVIDLKSMQWIETLDLGHEGRNPENLMLYENKLYSLNNRNYIEGSTISRIDLNSLSIQSTKLLPAVSSLCGTSVLAGADIYYQESGKTEIGRYQTQDGEAGPFTQAGTSFYGLSYDDRTKNFYGAETDFFSYGKVFVMDQTFRVLESFDAGISPGYFAVDYSSVNATSSAKPVTSILLNNLIREALFINPKLNPTTAVIFHPLGFTKNYPVQGQSIDLGSLPEGTYWISIMHNGQKLQEKFIKTRE